MTLKFCRSPWSEEPLSAFSSNRESDEDQAGEPRSRGDDLLTIPFQAKHIEKFCLWEKEFSVFFDDSKPVGLGFQPASVSNMISPVFAKLYACFIRDIAPKGLAADYNAKCREAGDYSRMIVNKLHVRMVNGKDVANFPYDDVLRMMRDAKPALTLTLVDMNSGQTISIFEERSKSVGSLALSRQSRRKSSFLLGPGKTQIRRNSQPNIKTKSDCLQHSQVITSDLDNSNLMETDHNLGRQQPTIVRDKLSTVEQGRDEAVKWEHETVSCQFETLLQETRKIQQERDDMVAVNKLLLNYKRASVTTQVELESIKHEQLNRLRRQEELEQTVTDLQAQLAEQITVAEKSQDEVNHLKHDKEMLALQWQELQDEHRDTQNQVEELHDRLVDAQRAHRAEEFVHAALRAAHAAKTQQVQELQVALEIATWRKAITPSASQSSFSAENFVGSIVTTQDDLKKDAISSRLLQAKMKDANTDINKYRDEVLAHLACQEQQLQQLQEQVRALKLVNTTSKQLLASLHSELREAQSRECNMRRELSAELEAVRNKMELESESTHELT